MKQTHIFKDPPGVIASAAVGGKMEGEGPMGEYFDKINDDPYMSADTFEKGESKLQKQALLHMFEKAGLKEAEITGRVGSETTSRAQVLSERLEIDPDIRWSRTGRIQLNEEVTVTLTMDVDIGFGGLGSFPIELTAQASGRSEVYWK